MYHFLPCSLCARPCVWLPLTACFHPAGKATRVGGEPGITRAVMSRIQVGGSAAGSRVPHAHAWCFPRAVGWPVFSTVLPPSARHVPHTGGPYIKPGGGHAVTPISWRREPSTCPRSLGGLFSPGSSACPHAPFMPWEENPRPRFISQTQWELMVWGSGELPEEHEPFGTGPQNLLRASEPSSLPLGATQQSTWRGRLA